MGWGDAWSQLLGPGFAEVFTSWGELVVLQGGEQGLQLQEEALAGQVAVGVHVEGELGADVWRQLGQGLEQRFGVEQGGAGDGDGFVA